MMGERSATTGELPRPGDVVAGKYRIERIIGEGGMGVVFEALHERLNQRFAVKVLRCNDVEKSDEFFGRFDREARAAAKLKGKNVARVTDVDVLADGTPFLVMEYLDGIDLDTELERRGRLPIGEAVDYVLQACSAVAEAHSRNIVHRDLKPHNLFLTQEDEEVVVKLLDFGISKLQDENETSVTLTRSTLGTPLYMAPEQIRATERADSRSDIWSLGIILYELLTGKTPFDGENPAAVIAAITADDVPPPNLYRPELSDALNRVVMRALEKRPDDRFQTAKDLADALAPFAVRASWVPPPRVSGVDFQVSVHDYPTLSLEELAASREVAGRSVALEAAASTDLPMEAVAPVTRRRRMVPILGLVAVAALATLVFLVSRSLDGPVNGTATDAADVSKAPRPAQPLPQEQRASGKSTATPVARSAAGEAAPLTPERGEPKGSTKSAPASKSRPRSHEVTPPPSKPPRPPKSEVAPKVEKVEEAPKPAPAPATENPVHL